MDSVPTIAATGVTIRGTNSVIVCNGATDYVAYITGIIYNL